MVGKSSKEEGEWWRVASIAKNGRLAIVPYRKRTGDPAGMRIVRNEGHIRCPSPVLLWRLEVRGEEIARVLDVAQNKRAGAHAIARFLTRSGGVLSSREAATLGDPSTASIVDRDTRAMYEEHVLRAAERSLLELHPLSEVCRAAVFGYWTRSEQDGLLAALRLRGAWALAAPRAAGLAGFPGAPRDPPTRGTEGELVAWLRAATEGPCPRTTLLDACGLSDAARAALRNGTPPCLARVDGMQDLYEWAGAAPARASLARLLGSGRRLAFVDADDGRGDEGCGATHEVDGEGRIRAIPAQPGAAPAATPGRAVVRGAHLLRGPVPEEVFAPGCSEIVFRGLARAPAPGPYPLLPLLLRACGFRGPTPASDAIAAAGAVRCLPAWEGPGFRFRPGAARRRVPPRAGSHAVFVPQESSGAPNPRIVEVLSLRASPSGGLFAEMVDRGRREDRAVRQEPGCGELWLAEPADPREVPAPAWAGTVVLEDGASATREDVCCAFAAARERIFLGTPEELRAALARAAPEPFAPRSTHALFREAPRKGKP